MLLERGRTTKSRIHGKRLTVSHDKKEGGRVSSPLELMYGREMGEFYLVCVKPEKPKAASKITSTTGRFTIEIP